MKFLDVQPALSRGRWWLIFIAAWLAGCAGPKDPQMQQGHLQGPVSVTTIKVMPATVPMVDEYAGRTAGVREVEVRARVSGILLERTYVEGERVDAGDVLFHIDPQPFAVALNRAEARVEEARANLRGTTRDWERTRALFADNAISQRERDDALSAWELAKAQLATAEAELNAAHIDLGYTSVRAPISGITSREVRSEGSLIGTGPSESLLTSITQLDPIYVNFAIPSTELARQRKLLASGALRFSEKESLSADLYYGGERYGATGVVSFTDSHVDMDTGTIRARAIFPNPDAELLPGQFVRLRVHGLVREGAFVVPETAVMQDADGTYLFVVQGGQASKRRVTPGPVTESGWLIDAGLKTGDEVVVEGVVKLQPGMAVEVAESEDMAALNVAEAGA